jgi:hypothetical protein
VNIMIHGSGSANFEREVSLGLLVWSLVKLIVWALSRG